MTPAIRASMIAATWIVGSTGSLWLIAIACDDQIGVAMLTLFGAALVLTPTFCVMGETIVEDGMKVVIMGTMAFLSWVATPFPVPGSVAVSIALGGTIAASLNYWLQAMLQIRSDRSPVKHGSTLT